MNRSYEMAEVEELKPKDFSPKELQWMVAMVGVCGVCGCAALLQNAWVVLGLLPVAFIVYTMRERGVESAERRVVGPENDQVFLPVVPRGDWERELRVYENRNAGKSPEDANL